LYNKFLEVARADLAAALVMVSSQQSNKRSSQQPSQRPNQRSNERSNLQSSHMSSQWPSHQPSQRSNHRSGQQSRVGPVGRGHMGAQPRRPAPCAPRPEPRAPVRPGPHLGRTPGPLLTYSARSSPDNLPCILVSQSKLAQARACCALLSECAHGQTSSFHWTTQDEAEITCNRTRMPTIQAQDGRPGRPSHKMCTIPLDQSLQRLSRTPGGVSESLEEIVPFFAFQSISALAGSALTAS
jgi:hypothetical protein